MIFIIWFDSGLDENRRLHLHNNDLADPAARAIASSLHNHLACEDLNLGHNRIGDDGASALAGAMLACLMF